MLAPPLLLQVLPPAMLVHIAPWVKKHAPPALSIRMHLMQVPLSVLPALVLLAAVAPPATVQQKTAELAWSLTLPPMFATVLTDIVLLEVALAQFALSIRTWLAPLLHLPLLLAQLVLPTNSLQLVLLV